MKTFVLGLLALVVFALIGPNASAQKAHGRIGLGTWKTQAEFRQVRVTSNDKALFIDDFSPGSAGWPYTHGEWAVQDGAYRQTDPSEDRRAYAGGLDWTDYTLTLQARKLGGQEGFLIFFRVADPDHYCVWALGGDGNTRTVLAKQVGTAATRLDPGGMCHIDSNRWYDLKVSVSGAHIRCWLDGKIIHDVVVQPLPDDHKPSPAADDKKPLPVPDPKPLPIPDKKPSLGAQRPPK